MNGSSIRAAVNRAIKTMGGEEKLVAGHGYCYFMGGNAPAWPACSVYVMRISDLPVDQWVDNYNALKADFDRYSA